jgi:aminoglycoside phosphotransferase (APT) family kinase protein
MTTGPRTARTWTPPTEDEFTSETAVHTLQAACATAGLDGRGAGLLRLGTNANYRLAAHPIMVRIAPGHLEDVRKELDVARWLASSGFPAARVVENIDQPLILGERAVTFWELIEENAEPAHVVDVARLLRDLHRLPEPRAFVLPRFEPLAHTMRRLGSAVDGEDVQFLRNRAGLLQRQFVDLEFVLPPGVIHGDAHEGNALRDRSGMVRLLDFESFAIGPREWDLGVLALRYRPFGWISKDDYKACVVAYGGFDVTEWSGFRVLQAIRELSMTTWLQRKARESPEHDAEFRKRMADLHDDNAPRHWRALLAG